MPAPRLVFIGDRPAQILGIVANAPLGYTGDKLSTFQVQAKVQAYVDYLGEHPQQLVEHRKIVLSTGLTWSPKYDGMIGKHLKTILAEAFVTPTIYVLGVSSRLITARDLNSRIEMQCRAGTMRRHSTTFLGSFEGSVEYPTQPSAEEALRIIEYVKADMNI